MSFRGTVGRLQRLTRAKQASASLALLAAVLLVAGCSSSSDGSAAAGGSPGAGQTKLIILALSFPCGLTQGTQRICDGAQHAADQLPGNYKFEIKSGTNFSDNVAFNSLLQTSLELHPAGLIVFPIGPAAQTPVLNKACDAGAKIVTIESSASGVTCLSTFVHPNALALGGSVAKWLIAHPSATKDIAIVTQPPGQFASTDDRVKGFKDVVEAAGYHVVGTAVTDQSLDKTRTEVTNMMTAHPSISAVFSANGPIGQGTAQALRNNRSVRQLSLDFDPSDIAPIESGELSAVGRQNPFAEGELAVENLYKVLQGTTVPAVVYSPLESVVDESNVRSLPSPSASN
jgi:ribose transport system substrate-binding protein